MTWTTSKLRSAIPPVAMQSVSDIVQGGSGALLSVRQSSLIPGTPELLWHVARMFCSCSSVIALAATSVTRSGETPGATGVAFAGATATDGAPDELDEDGGPDEPDEDSAPSSPTEHPASNATTATTTANIRMGTRRHLLGPE
jgi:hypothetical protein